MSLLLTEGENHTASASTPRAAGNSLVLTDISSLKRLAEGGRSFSHGGLYEGIARALAKQFQTKQTLSHLVETLCLIADHAYSLRRLEIVGVVAHLLLGLPRSQEAENAGLYYKAMTINRGGLGDTGRAGFLFERLADSPSPLYRAKAMLTLGGRSLIAGNQEAALSFYREVMRSTTRGRVVDAVTLYFTSRMIAVVKGMNGDHQGAVADLEKIAPLTRVASSVHPYAYYDYLNTLAVELAEVGLLEQARRAAEIALASPFASAYPEWHETFDDIVFKQRRSSRSIVAGSVFIAERDKALQRTRETQTVRRHAGKTHKLLSFPGPQPAVNAELEYTQPQASQARVLDFQEWKHRVEPNPAHLSALSREQRTEMTTGEKLIRLMDLISRDDTDDETIDTILEAVEEIVLKNRNKKLE